MEEIYKAHFESDDSNLRFTMPIAKIDEERRIVSGFATLDNIDRQGDRLLSEASRKAFENFRGNIRLMHQPIPAGKLISFRENSFYDPKTSKTYSGVFVDAYISKGAENIWQMVLDGTLTGFSVGGKIVDFESAMDTESEQPIRIVKQYELMELSLVDSPANQFANILSIQKVDDKIITTGIATGYSIENIFWCKKDEIAISDESEELPCVMCTNDMERIGWVESNDPNKELEFSKAIGIAKGRSDMGEHGMKENKEKNKLKKGRSIQENSPQCDGGFAVISEDGEVHGCYVSRQEAQAAIDQHNSEEGMNDSQHHSEDMAMKETITSENTPNKNPQQGMPGRVSEMVSRKKKKVILKAGKGSVSSGDFVAYAVNKDPQPTQYAKGKVESVKTSGTVNVRGTNEKIQATADNPVVIIRVYRQTDSGKYVPTDRRVAKKISNVRKLKPLENNMNKAEQGSSARLRELVTQHNQKYGNVSSKKVTFAMLREVYNRGIGAYRTNPGSVRPNVASAEQWALARVNGFLLAVRSGRFKRKPFDTDLLPSGHPLSTKNKKSDVKKSDSIEEGGVEVADNVDSPELDTADAEEVEFEVEESIEEVDEADDNLEKADGVVEEQAVDTSEQFDLAKALGEVKSLVENAIARSVEVSSTGIDAVSNSISDLSKSFEDKIAQLQSKYEELAKSFADLSNNTQELATRVDSVESDTAMKKSGELEFSAPEQPIMKKSLWGGRFLNSADVF